MDKDNEKKNPKTRFNVLYVLINLILTVAWCIIGINCLGPKSDYCIITNIVLTLIFLAVLIYTIYAIHNERKNIYWYVIFHFLSYMACLISTNHWYSTEVLKATFPSQMTWLENKPIGSIFLIFLGCLFLIFIITILIVKLIKYYTPLNNRKGETEVEDKPKRDTNIRYIPYNTDLTSANIPIRIEPIEFIKTSGGGIHKEEINKKNNIYTLFTLIITILSVVTTILFALWLFTKINFPQMVNQIDLGSADIYNLIGNLFAYVMTIVIGFLFVTFVLYAILECCKFIIQNIKEIYENWKNGKFENDDQKIRTFSVLIVIVILITIFYQGEFTLDNLYDLVVKGDYVAMPLLVIGGIALVFLLIKLTNFLLRLIIAIVPDESTDVNPYADKIKTISKKIIDIVLDSIETAIDFIKFIPDFFGHLSKVVLNNTEDKDDSSEKEIEIIKIAAFCFAIVSFISTGYGLSNYVYTGNLFYIAILVSFAVQSILFIFNLKLPSFFSKVKRKTLFIIFYSVLLCTSSILSYVYTVNAAYAESRYSTSAELLERKYNEFWNDANKYSSEVKKIYQLAVDEKLTELKAIWDKNNLDTMREVDEEIINEIKEIENHVVFKEKYENLSERTYIELTNGLKDRYIKYIKTLTPEKLEEEKERLKNTYVALNKDNTVSQSQSDGTDKINTGDTWQTKHVNFFYKLYLFAKEVEITDDKKYDDSVKQILIKMLQSEFNEEMITEQLENLSNIVIQMNEEGEIKNIAEIVKKINELNLIFNNYPKLTQLAKIQEFPSIPDQKDSQETILEWDQQWLQIMEELKGHINSLPEYTEQTSGDDVTIDGNSVNDFIKNKHKMVKEIDDLLHYNLSSVNPMERAAYLLVEWDNYNIIAVYSLGLAFFLDMASLLAGLFIYYIEKKDKSNNS